MKRIFDIVASVCLLVLLLPLMLWIAWQVRRHLGVPVLFRQTRPGKNGRLFQMIKFRTMRDAVNVDGRPLPDVERITPFGQWLRSTSLDELPELWNVLKGEMSLVGPRPITREELLRYGRNAVIYTMVRPGITGLWQVSGRNNAEYRRRVAMDVCYVKRQSAVLDLWILFRTVIVVLTGRGAY